MTTETPTAGHTQALLVRASLPQRGIAARAQASKYHACRRVFALTSE